MGDGAFSQERAVKLEIVIQHTLFFSDQAVEVAQGGGWEEVGDNKEEADENGKQQVEKAVQELLTKGSKALKDEDFVGAVDCKRRILEIRLGFFLSTWHLQLLLQSLAEACVHMDCWIQCSN